MTRQFSFRLNPPATFHGAKHPSVGMAHADLSPRRRLNDGVEAIFTRALALRDVEAAADLLAVLEKWHAQRPAHRGGERRWEAKGLWSARRDLERLRSLRQPRQDPAGRARPDQGPIRG